MKEEFDKGGIAYEQPRRPHREARRVSDRFSTRCCAARSATFEGKHYQISGLKGSPRPRQGPRPPIAVGGGGPKMLALAAKHADIISVATPTNAEGKLLLSGITMEKTIERVERIREAAGERFDEIELNWTITMIVITDDREQTAEMALAALDQGFPPNIEVDVKLIGGGDPELAVPGDRVRSRRSRSRSDGPREDDDVVRRGVPDADGSVRPDHPVAGGRVTGDTDDANL